jgi:hypothetical protein
MHRTQKAVAYVNRGDHLLVLRHTDDPSFVESGLQVPAGTVRDDGLDVPIRFELF